MTNLQFILKSFYYYRRSHLNVILGFVLATGILVGSLIIGDSVKYSLQNIVLSRLGNAEFVLVSYNRFFSSDIADKINKKLDIPSAPVLQLKGIAGSAGNEKNIQNVQICGIDEKFWKIGGTGNKSVSLGDDDVAINTRLAAELNIKINDELLLKIEKPRFVPLDAPFIPGDQNFVALRLTVKAILSKKQFGDFTIKNNQVAPYNVFVSLKQLSKYLKLQNKANIVLFGNRENISESDINKAICESWRLADINLKFRNIPALNQVELSSDRIFIEDTIVSLVQKSEKNSTPVFTYLVNSIRKDSRETPYSFATAPGEMIVRDLKDNEAIINEWTADDIKAKVGDEIELSYFIVGPLRKLKEEKSAFKIREIIPFKGLGDDRFLMPEFEGMANVDHCREWETGIPVDFKKIRPKDEEYWKAHKGTPKVFLSYKTAKKLWGSRFGNCTAIRFNDTLDVNKLSEKILAGVSPGNVGLYVTPVKKEGIQSAANGVDFGQLFLGLSFFLLLAAFILTALLFSLNIDKRAKELGILLALGFHPRRVKKLLLAEGAVIAAFSLVPGALLGIYFNQMVLLFLNHIWNDIVRTSSIQFHAKPVTVIMGCTISFIFALLIMIIAIRGKARFSVHNLQRRIFQTAKRKKKNSWISLVIFMVCVIAVFVLIFSVKSENKFQNPSLFYIMGVLILSGFLAISNFIIHEIQNKRSVKLNYFNLGIRSITYNKKQNMVLLSLLSIATFLVISVGLNRTDFYRNAFARESGTGGFLFYGETTFPVLYDLNSKPGKENYGLGELDSNVSFVQIKSMNGDDASCLNLNRVSKPVIIGVNPDEFIKRNAFSFTRVDNSINTNLNFNPWSLLNTQLGKNIYPAIADMTVIQWGLGKSVGDTLKYSNEYGDTIRLKLVAGLANSIFQGSIIVSEDVFVRNFPGVGGSNILLIDAPIENKMKIKELMESRFQNLGITLVPSSERLTNFNSVTNTYLDIFLSLGAIALILSTLGIAIVIVRNIQDQKHEFAMMQALGIHRKTIVKLIVTGNFMVLISGFAIGLFAAMIATLPSVASSGTGIPHRFLLIIILVFTINGISWIFFTARFMLKENFLINLRNE
ncbi:MAG: FtsX-like permease family protein [Bacteroidia bacterium]|nr:FtsX-like permease family protein [Bacteroidia bacterium]